MRTTLTEQQAIRQAIQEGAGGDFCDVAEAVKKSFGLNVSAQLVEDVYRSWKQESSFSAKDAPGMLVGSGGTPSVSRLESQTENTKKRPMIGDLHFALESEIPVEEVSMPSHKNEPHRPERDKSQRDRVLEFVQLMGGFEAARAAITEVESSLRQLMK